MGSFAVHACPILVVCMLLLSRSELALWWPMYIMLLIVVGVDSVPVSPIHVLAHSLLLCAHLLTFCVDLQFFLQLSTIASP